eukprot:3746169-Prymnesium_polylepis.1
MWPPKCARGLPTVAGAARRLPLPLAAPRGAAALAARRRRPPPCAHLAPIRRLAAAGGRRVPRA